MYVLKNSYGYVNFECPRLQRYCQPLSGAQRFTSINALLTEVQRRLRDMYADFDKPVRKDFGILSDAFTIEKIVTTAETTEEVS